MRVPAHALFLPCALLTASCATARPPATAPVATAHEPHAAHGPHAGAHGHHAGGHHHAFEGAARWSAVFDDPARDAWQRPDEVLRALALAPDARVADVGAGTGYFSVRVARAVPRGRVWGVDLEPEMVAHLRERAERERLDNLFAVLCTARDAMIPERVDVILVVDTNHHIDDRVEYYRRLARSLRPGGRVVIVDFTRDAPEGPPPEMRLSPSEVDAEMTAAGYARDGEPLILSRQYVLAYRPQAAPSHP